MKIGYARVSTTGQSLESQLETLKNAGCDKVYQEKLSGKSADNRERLQTVLEFIQEGDILICTKLDRLARSISDLWSIVNLLESKKAHITILDQPLIDTSKPEGKLVMTMFGYVAETERALILERTANGRAKAKAKGVQFGRKPKLDDNKLQSAIDDYKQGSLSASDVAKKYGISRASLYRLMNT